MKIEVRLFAQFRDVLPKEARGITEADLPEHSTGEDLIEFMNLPRETPIILLVNGRRSSLDEILHDGDRVGIFPPVGGG